MPSPSVLFLVSTAALLAPDEVPGPVAAFLHAARSVGPEGAGNVAAGRAWRELVGAVGADAVPALLAGLDGASPVAANWIRSAVDAVAGRGIAKGQALPRERLEKFLLDRSHDPRARRLAWELLVRVEPAARERLVAGMLDDPSVELRREAVARLVRQAEAAGDGDDATRARSIYRKALTASRDVDQINEIARRLRDLGEEVDLVRHFGFLTRWSLIGPFDNSERSGFDAVFPPERGVDLDAACEGLDGPARWTEHVSTHELGIVDLNRAIAHRKEVTAYAHTPFTSERERDVDFRLATVNAFKLWLNGELIFARNEYHHGTELDHYRARGRLRAGRNDILLKVLQNEQTQDWADHWRFQIRVCDATGTAVLSADGESAAAGGSR